jgi:ribosome-binding factor A
MTTEPSRRQKQVAELLQQELSLLIQRRVHDPRVKGVTITHVDVSLDLRNAKIFIMVSGDDLAAKKALEGLKHASGFFRRELGASLELRYMPELLFVRDVSLEHGLRIDRILDDLKDDSNPSE